MSTPKHLHTMRRIHLAVALVVAGLLVQLATTLLWSPLMFVLFAAVGLPLVGIGAGLFLWAVWRHIEKPAAVQDDVP